MHLVKKGRVNRMNLILKEVKGDIAEKIEQEINDGVAPVQAYLWNGMTMETNMVEIRFDPTDIAFSSYMRDGMMMFEFMDINDMSRLCGKATILEVSASFIKGYEVK